MVLTRIRRSLANDDGAAVPMILSIILFVMVGFAVLFQFLYARATLNTIHDACVSVAESVLIANTDASYQAKRDGYAGVWHLDDGEVSNSTVYIDPKAALARQLNLVIDGETLGTAPGGAQTYRLRDIRLTIQNPDFQDSGPSLVSTLSLTVDLTLNFPLIDSHPVSIPIEVSAAWRRKF